MSTDSEEEQIIKYLLGQLSPEEEVQVEDRYLLDAEGFEQICAIEDDLIEDYLAGALPQASRAQFDKVYRASPERLRRLQQASDLREVLKTAWLERDSAAELPREKPVAARFFSLVLFPGIARDADEEIPAVDLTSTPPEVVFELDLNTPREFEAYAVKLHTSEGTLLFSLDGLNAVRVGEDSRVQVPVPTLSLKPGDYVASLRGLSSGSEEFLDRYYFRVTRRATF